MRTFVYGIIFGAATMYLYMIHGSAVDTTLTSVLAWRDGAKQSVYGYGGAKD